MELHVTQENLSRALSTVARVANTRSTLPILSNVLLQIEDNRLRISATNLDIAISELVGAKVIKSGSVTVPARLTQDFVNNLPSGTIKIKQDEHKVYIESGKYSSTINGSLADEFPVMPAIKKGKSWSISASDFKNGLQQVVFAASNDEARPVLTGVYIHSVKNKLIVATTDSYRLAEKQLTASKEEVKLLIPANAMGDLLRVVRDDVDEISVTHDDQQVLFQAGDTELVARLIEGQYPDYQKLIPTSFQTSATADKQELMNITKVSSLFARENAGSITINVDKAQQNISIKSIASQVGENTASTEADVTEDGTITVNSRYLLEGLQAINSKKITINFNGKLEPVLIKGVDDDTYMHIVMPLKS